MNIQNKPIAFQGAPGAYSDLSCRVVFPDKSTLPCKSFDDAFDAVRNGDADLAMIPVDNTIAGRVADVHRLIPEGQLYIIGEHFQPINHAFLGIKGAKIEDIRDVHSHVHALPQCKDFIKARNLNPIVHSDTAGAAREISKQTDKSQGAIASELAAEIYNLEILERDVHDDKTNVTRFLILAPEPITPPLSKDKNKHFITSLIFEVRNIPAALYKCLGGFATNGINLTRLESYVNENFEAARFYIDIEEHSETKSFQNAIEELGFYAKDVQFLGTYPAHPTRYQQ